MTKVQVDGSDQLATVAAGFQIGALASLGAVSVTEPTELAAGRLLFARKTTAWRSATQIVMRPAESEVTDCV